MKLFDAAGTRELDRLAAEQLALPGEELMERAGAAVLREIRKRWPDAHRIIVLVGAGNNGGDGYVIARHAVLAGLPALCIPLLPPAKEGAAGLNAQRARQLEGVTQVATLEAAEPTADDVIVDAVFGTGLSRPVSGALADQFAVANTLPAARVAVDIPSGVCADTGALLGQPFEADLTVTFIAEKLGLVTGPGAAVCGERVLDRIGVSPRLEASVEPVAEGIGPALPQGALPRRRRDAHKGDHGHVLVVGGYEGMGGAALLAGEAAARSGAGLTSLATWPGHAGALVSRCPVLMVAPVATADDLAPLLARASVVLLGPGLGQAPWGQHLFDTALAAACPLVVDADGLNWLAAKPQRRDDWVLTPHPGEAARLLGCTTAEVQGDRLAAVRALGERYGGIAVLKGNGTVIGGAGLPAVCLAGNPGMGTGGMGDVLGGIIAALLAQGPSLGLSTEALVRHAVLVHAVAADELARRSGERGLLASDLPPTLPALLNGRP